MANNVKTEIIYDIKTLNVIGVTKTEKLTKEEVKFKYPEAYKKFNDKNLWQK